MDSAPVFQYFGTDSFEENRFQYMQQPKKKKISNKFNFEVDSLSYKLSKSNMTENESNFNFTFGEKLIEKEALLLQQSEDFERLLNNETLSDITLIIGDKLIKAHKNILAIRSPVFSEIFDGKSNINELEIHGIRFEIVQSLLFFMYTGRVQDLDLITSLDLLVAADKYRLQGLKIKCQEILLQNLSTENAIDQLIFSQSCNANLLKSSAINLIVDHFSNFGGDDFRKIINSDSELLVEILEKFNKKSKPVFKFGTSSGFNFTPSQTQS